MGSDIGISFLENIAFVQGMVRRRAMFRRWRAKPARCGQACAAAR
ncbi:hypothetical protein J121_2528 [Qipengyuania citrea LAMA 915]|uniref:Uncharacterized protein n=1 Tax=Qipengyuania citrea LAMA 915 TaxID=1306953 RepID=A0A0L1KE00_9SPHN|nr:hypothetical protein J121_2528 [Qipengyuania citrea LAMA 915]